jgi:hypothetical protein
MSLNGYPSPNGATVRPHRLVKADHDKPLGFNRNLTRP